MAPLSCTTLLGSTPDGYFHRMKLMRAVALAGIAKKLYDEARKPENQARMRAAADKIRERRNRPR